MIYLIIPHRPNSLNIVNLLNRNNIYYADKSRPKGFKIIFVSDGPSDITYQDYIGIEDVYIFLTSCIGAGACGARNFGLAHVLTLSGDKDHVVFFDDDDFIDTVDLEQLSKMTLNRMSSYFLDYSIYNGLRYKNINVDRLNQKHEKVYEYNIYGPPFRHILSLARLKERSIFWDLSLVSCQDWDFFARFYSNDYRPIHLPGFNLVYNELLSGITKSRSKILEGRLQFYSKWKHEFPLNSKYLFFFNSLIFFIKRKSYGELFVFYKRIEIDLSLKALLLIPHCIFRR